MEVWKQKYIYDWLPNPNQHRFYGYPGQVWIKDFKDIIIHSIHPIGKWLDRELFCKSGEVPKQVKRKVEDYFITIPYFNCSLAKYQVTEQPRKTYGQTEMLVWDFDNKENIDIAYSDMQKISNYIYTKTGKYPTIHSSGNQGFHLFIYLPYPVDSTYKDGVEITLRQITNAAGVYIPSNDEINRSKDTYEGDNKIEPEDRYWSVDPAVWSDVTQSRLIRVPFTPRKNGNYCYPIKHDTPLDQIHNTTGEIIHQKNIWNELVDLIIRNQLIYSRNRAAHQENNQIRKINIKKTLGDKYVDFNTLNCQDVWTGLFNYESREGNYLRAYCPYCNSGSDRKQPSVRVFSDGFKCHGSCKKSGGAWAIAALSFGDDKEKIKEYLKGV